MLNRRTFFTFILLLAIAACDRSAQVAVPEGTTLIILRHADRDDVQLNAKGRARAEALVAALEGVRIDAIYAPQIQRNIDTAKPLATARGMEIKLVERFDAADSFLEIVAASGGQTIVWVGNKDNISPIWEALGLDRPSPIEYGDLFFVDGVSSVLPKVTRLRFGAE
jgi:hypothetical protein